MLYALTFYEKALSRVNRISAVQMQRRLRVMAALLVASLTIFIFLATPHRPTLAQQTQASLEVVGLLNAWRIEQGLWPLKINPTLEALALLQAQYVVSLREAPEGADIHLDGKGQGPAQRALLQPYEWPSYGRADRT